jgi:site-specific DNA-methyltransferase (adenine-specific)
MVNFSGFHNIPLHTDQIITGDCLDVMQKFPDDSVDLIVTDPSYGIDYQSNRRKVKDKFAKMAGDTLPEISLILESFYKIAFRILKPGAHCYTFNKWTMYPLFLGQSNQAGFYTKNCLVWIKDNHGSGDLFGAYAPRHEFCLFCVKPGHPNRILRGKRTSDCLFYSKVPSPKLLHATQKPLRMMAHLIERSSEPGDLILDPFAGSGSTCKAAKLLGRKYIGVEIDRSIAATARENLKGLE